MSRGWALDFENVMSMQTCQVRFQPLSSCSNAEIENSRRSQEYNSRRMECGQNK